MHPMELAQSAAWLVIGDNTQRFNDMAEHFQDRGAGVSATEVVVFCALVVLLCIVLWRVARMVAMRDGRSYFSTKRLFKQLCQQHDLDWPSCQLLRRLARARRLENPAQLFLEPDWFDAVEIPVPLRPFRPQLEQIKQRLFD